MFSRRKRYFDDISIIVARMCHISREKIRVNFIFFFRFSQIQELFWFKMMKMTIQGVS